MAVSNRPFLDLGELFPTLTFSTVDGDSITLPEYGHGQIRILLIYRGNW